MPGPVAARSAPAPGDAAATGPIRRVLWLVKGLGPGGAEQLLLLAARRRDRAEAAHRVAYLLPHKDALVAAIEAEGVPTECLAGRRSWDPRWLLRLRRAMGAADVVHAHSPVLAIAARLLRPTLPRDARPRLVSTEHNVWASHHPATRLLDRATFGLDDAHLAVSEAVRRSVPAPKHDAVEVVVHGVDIADVRSRADRAGVRAELGIPDDALVVGTVANLRANKAYPDLLAAAVTVLDAEPDVRFVAVGQGPLEAEIRARRDELGLGDRFSLLGHRPDAVRVASAFDVFCLASHHEGMPVALMEALALGIPIVATRVGGADELLVDGVEGLLVPPAAPDRLAEALIAVLSDPPLRAKLAEGAAARGSQLSVDSAVRRAEAIHRELTAGRGRSSSAVDPS